MTFGQGHDTPLGHGQQLCEILSRSTMALRSYGLILGHGHDPPLGHKQQLCEILSRAFGIEKLWPGHGFWVCVHCDLDLGDMTLGHGQQLCEILSRSNMGLWH